jgi:quinolinate synthase
MAGITASDKELIAKINKLKEERNAVILAHNYQLGEIQDIADYVGDSFGLSVRAAETRAEVIIFCGVHFMAETAAIICPNKKVLLPDRNAGCAMANMITVRQLREMKRKHPNAVVVTYINSTADIKAESDYCCTSANAKKVVEVIPEEKEILFIPDQHLGEYAARQTDRHLILWPGHCPTHTRILPEDITRLKKEHPRAEVMVHPECTSAVIDLADHVFSTGGMIRHAPSSSATEFVIGTESGIIHRLRKENPGKRFYEASRFAVCENMKLINLEKVLWSLEDDQYLVKPDPGIAEKAKLSIDRMLAIG